MDLLCHYIHLQLTGCLRHIVLLSINLVTLPSPNRLLPLGTYKQALAGSRRTLSAGCKSWLLLQKSPERRKASRRLPLGHGGFLSPLCLLQQGIMGLDRDMMEPPMGSWSAALPLRLQGGHKPPVQVRRLDSSFLYIRSMLTGVWDHPPITYLSQGVRNVCPGGPSQLPGSPSWPAGPFHPNHAHLPINRCHF